MTEPAIIWQARRYATPRDPNRPFYVVAITPDGKTTGAGNIAGNLTEDEARMISAAPIMATTVKVAKQFCNDRGGSWADFETVVNIALERLGRAV